MDEAAIKEIEQFKNYKYIPEILFRGIQECFNKKIIKQLKF